MAPADADPERYFPIGTLFNVTAYREATRDLTTERAIGAIIAGAAAVSAIDTAVAAIIFNLY